MKRAVSVALAAMLAAGCAAGPDYRSPLPGAPAQTPLVGAAAPVYSPDEPPREWWRLYDDPALDAAVDEALAANTDLRVAAANLARAQAFLRGARSERLPSTALSAGSTTGRQNVVGQGAPISFEDTVYTVGLDASYPLDLFGRVRRAIEAASADAESAQAAYDVVRTIVAAETARAYADACAAAFELGVAESSTALQRESLALTERLLDAGRGTALDVSRAAAQLEQTRAQMPTLEARRTAALYRLAVLQGRPPAEFPPEAGSCETVPALSAPLPVGDGATLLARRPDVRQAERALASATARIGVAVADLRPRIDINASAGAVALDAGDLDESDASRWSIGPLLSFSFPNRAAARARLAAAEADAEAALATFDGTWLEALRETETALADYARELERRDALASARGHAAEAARLANLRFDAGQVSFLDVLQAELVLAEAEAALARSEARTVELQIALFLALGGGW